MNKIKWIATELLNTLSNSKSFFSSKRIERLFMFLIFCWMVIGYVRRRWDEMTTEDVTILGTMLLGAGILQTIQIRKDLKNGDSN